MVQLHFNGSVFDLSEDWSVADVFNVFNNVAPQCDGQTWLNLADGGAVHIQVGNDRPTFAVVAPPGYRPEGLKATD